jgi:hypothetical protein
MPGDPRLGEAGAHDVERGTGMGVLTGGTQRGTGGTDGAKGAGASQADANDRETESGTGTTHANLADGNREE